MSRRLEDTVAIITHGQLRAFGSLTFREIGQFLDLSESSARLDWQFSRAWLRAELSDDTSTAHDDEAVSE